MQLEEFTFIVKYITKAGNRNQTEYTVTALNDNAARIKVGMLFRQDYDRLTKRENI